MDDELNRRLAVIESKLDLLDKKLFRGNGTPPFDIRMDRAERFIKAQIWLIAIILGTFIPIAIKTLFQ